jgi:hypothetical protein
MIMLAELGTRRQRKLFGKPPDNTDYDWKNTGDLIIQVGQNMYSVTDFKREEIKNLVVANQNKGVWTEPVCAFSV